MWKCRKRESKKEEDKKNIISIYMIPLPDLYCSAFLRSISLIRRFASRASRSRLACSRVECCTTISLSSVVGSSSIGLLHCKNFRGHPPRVPSPYLPCNQPILFE